MEKYISQESRDQEKAQSKIVKENAKQRERADTKAARQEAKQEMFKERVERSLELISQSEAHLEDVQDQQKTQTTEQETIYQEREARRQERTEPKQDDGPEWEW